LIFALGLRVFPAGTRRYRFKKLTGSLLTQFTVVLVATWCKRRLNLPSDLAMLYDIDVGKVAAAGTGVHQEEQAQAETPPHRAVPVITYTRLVFSFTIVQ
jgi:hypothetical protein